MLHFLDEKRVFLCLGALGDQIHLASSDCTQAVFMLSARVREMCTNTPMKRRVLKVTAGT